MIVPTELRNPSHAAVWHGTCCLFSSSSRDADENHPITTTTRERLTSNKESFHDTSDSSAIQIHLDIPKTPTIPGAEKGGRKLAAVFTCKVCGTRSIKQFTEHAYTFGVVIATCGGCKNKHLLADRLGYFDDQDIDLERITRENGEHLTTVTTGTTEIDLETLLGKEKLQELIQQASEDDENSLSLEHTTTKPS